MVRNYFIIYAAIVLFVLLPSVVEASVAVRTSTSVKEVALTFDDGPYGTSTIQILAILKKEHVPATFFLIGRNVEKYPELTREIVADGNAIGNHTYDHTKHLTGMSLADVRNELSMTDTAVASTTGIHTKLFRPPYGKITKKLRKELQLEGYRVVMWNSDPRDWSASSTSKQIVARALHEDKKYLIIVLHDGRDTKINYSRDNVIHALPTLIEDLKQRGYLFVKYDQSGHSPAGSVKS